VRSSELKVGEAYKVHHKTNCFMVRAEIPKENVTSKFQIYLSENSTFLVVQEFENGNLLKVLMQDGIRWFYRSSTAALNFLPA